MRPIYVAWALAVAAGARGRYLPHCGTTYRIETRSSEGGALSVELTSQDITEIQQLLALYGHAADSPTPDLFEKVFSEDAVFRSGATGLAYEGLAAIQAWFAQGKPPHPPAHQTTNVYAYVEGDTVRAKSKYLAINPKTGLPRVGDYNDVLVRTECGWRIRERVSSDRFGAYTLEG
jgi:hypothetical protein